MKRIAAVAALIVTMLAVPAAAMASTTGSGSNLPGQGPSMCPPPYLLHHRPHYRNLNGYRHHRVRRSVTCAVTTPYPPQSQNCPSGYAYGQSQSFTFSVASGSSTAVELSGPTLAPAEEFTYDGNTYTIWSVNAGDNSFTMSQGATLFVNGGAATLTGAGQLLCSN